MTTKDGKERFTKGKFFQVKCVAATPVDCPTPAVRPTPLPAPMRMSVKVLLSPPPQHRRDRSITTPKEYLDPVNKLLKNTMEAVNK